MAITAPAPMTDSDFQALNLRMLSGQALSPEEPRAFLTEAERRDRGSLFRIGLVLFGRTRELARAQTALEEAQKQLARISAPPQYPADVTRAYDDGRLEVVAAGRRAIVHRAAEIVA